MHIHKGLESKGIEMKLHVCFQRRTLYSMRYLVLFVAVLCSGWTSTAWATPRLATAVYQSLGVKKRLPIILEAVRSAYTQRTGEAALSLSNINLNLENFGLSKLGNCAQKIPCLLKTSKENLPRSVHHALYLGVGAIGQKILVQFILLDLKQNKRVLQKNQSFANMSELKTKMYPLMKTFFPNYGKVKIIGSPLGAQIEIDGRERGKLPSKALPVPSQRAIQVRVYAPKYNDWTQKLTFEREKTRTLQIKLTPKAVKKRKVLVRLIPRPRPLRRKPLQPKPKAKGTPFYKTWWFWTATGVVVAGGVAATVGIVSQNPYDVSSPFPAR